VLRRYDEHLTAAERAFLALFSAFRAPVHENAFDRVFRASVGVEKKPGFLDRLLGRRGEVASPPEGRETLPLLDDAQFTALLGRLLKYRLLRHDPRERTYTAHPLVRAHYLAQLTAGPRAGQQDAHERIKDYYLELAGDTPRYPTLEDLAPLIEVVHHACRAGAYDEAVDITYQRVYQGYPTRVLVNQLGAWETALALMLEFFPEGDTAALTIQEPQVSKPSDKSWILNEAGLCLMSLGRLAEAVPFWERALPMALEVKDWPNASQGYQNLADLHAHLGALEASAGAARRALELAHRAENKRHERNSLAYSAWAAHLRGELKTAASAFRQAEALEGEIDSSMRYLYSLRGIQHADHLRRAGDPAYARRVTEANLEICQRARWPDDLSRSHRILGDLDSDAGQHASARAHYDQALKIARGITHRHSLIEALLARGRRAARRTLAKVPNLRKGESRLDQAFSDLNEALGYATAGGYRIYEADTRVALAWAYLAAGEHVRARQEAQRARQLSAEMGYHWGGVDAAEVLEAIAAGK